MRAPSLTRGWVYRLQLLLALASVVIIGSESRETNDHILLSQIRGSRNLEGQVPVFISHRNKMVRLYIQALGSRSTFNSSVRTSQETFRLHNDDQPVNAV
jgi:uncharacterized protein (DUF2141 family)